ncbi:biotin--[acetyl-CoA-carboxylase] ligase [Halobaculum sp. MBLA0147]|uniref:biotin--[acetyl-CoA-carboxylase] ligase n=1 Tax=Halobaculum sp. MBLA0147 TaxID=3079934 RepID=UPI003523A82A
MTDEAETTGDEESAEGEPTADEATDGEPTADEATDDGYEYDADGIRAGLDADFAVEYHETLGSSNDRAKTLAAEGAPETVVVADEQTAPRGREGREWSSPAGGVWVSLLVWPDAEPAATPLYTLATAVAITEACREAGVRARIKWPNDVLVGTDGDRGGAKLCGVLTESGQTDGSGTDESSRDDDTAQSGDRWLVIGIGLNANVDPAALPAEADATSLRAERGADVDRRRLLQTVLDRFDELRGDPDAVLPAWREYADTLDRRVRVETPGGTVVGEAVDVRFPGSLVVRTDDGDEVVVTAGDCEHLRPIGN